MSPAYLGCPGTPVVEPAAGWGVYRGSQASPDLHGGPLHPGVGDGHGGDERLGVGVEGVLQQILRLRHLHDLPQVHHGDAVAHVAGHGQVVIVVDKGGPIAYNASVHQP